MKEKIEIRDDIYIGLSEPIVKGYINFPNRNTMTVQGTEKNVLLPNIREIIQYIGDDPNRAGLRKTPDRVLKSWKELFSGYSQIPIDVLRGKGEGHFDNGASDNDGQHDEMVLLKDIEFFSTCEHHMLPFMGTAHIAYIPDKRLVGISKLARILEVYSRRLQIQERICVQVTAILNDVLEPKGSACVLEAKHLCISCRGVQKQHSVMVTSSLTGVFRNPEVRQELFSLIKGR